MQAIRPHPLQAALDAVLANADFAANPPWTPEGIAFRADALDASGQCPAGRVPVFCSLP
jgi:hypothetical protein